MNRNNGYRTAFIIALMALILMALTSAAFVMMYIRDEAYLQKIDVERNDAAAETAGEIAEKQQRIERLEKILKKAGIDESLISDSDLEEPEEGTASAQVVLSSSDSTAQTTDDANKSTTKAPKTEKATQYNPPAHSDNEQSWSDEWD